jgi:hypothetical protein
LDEAWCISAAFSRTVAIIFRIQQARNAVKDQNNKDAGFPLAAT